MDTHHGNTKVTVSMLVTMVTATASILRHGMGNKIHNTEKEHWTGLYSSENKLSSCLLGRLGEGLPLCVFSRSLTQSVRV